MLTSMVRNEKNNVSSHQNEHHRRILSSLLREEGNRRCADCLSRGPTWASVNLGVFVCLNCSGRPFHASLPTPPLILLTSTHYHLTHSSTFFCTGIHRSLGVHNSKVRSTSLVSLAWRVLPHQIPSHLYPMPTKFSLLTFFLYFSPGHMAS